MTEIRCKRCGDTDGPFQGFPHDALCEPCARPVPLANGIQPALDGTLPAPRKTRTQRRAEDYETWIAEVWPVYVAAAESGAVFTTYGIAEAHNLPEPPDGAHHWGRLMTLLKDEGLTRTAGWTCSERPTAHASGVRKWRGTRRAINGAAREGRAA